MVFPWPIVRNDGRLSLIISLTFYFLPLHPIRYQVYTGLPYLDGGFKYCCEPNVFGMTGWDDIFLGLVQSKH
jgi:hypothetical protein